MGIIAYLLIFGFLFINMGELLGGKGGFLIIVSMRKRQLLLLFFNTSFEFIVGLMYAIILERTFVINIYIKLSQNTAVHVYQVYPPCNKTFLPFSQSECSRIPTAKLQSPFKPNSYSVCRNLCNFKTFYRYKHDTSWK